MFESTRDYEVIDTPIDFRARSGLKIHSRQGLVSSNVYVGTDMQNESHEWYTLWISRYLLRIFNKDH